MPEHTAEPLIERLKAHREMTHVCLSYFGLRCFQPDSTEEEVNLAVMNGDLRLHAYVSSAWTFHLMEAYEWETEALPKAVQDSVFSLMKAYIRSDTLKLAENGSPADHRMDIRAGIRVINAYRRDVQSKLKHTTEGWYCTLITYIPHSCT